MKKKRKKKTKKTLKVTLDVVCFSNDFLNLPIDSGAVVAQVTSAQRSEREVSGSIFSDLTSVSTFL